MKYDANKRKFLITTTLAAGAICAWEPLVSICKAVTTTAPRRLSLNGDWQVSEMGKNEWLAATVPGCVHTDLLAAGKIPDPFYRDNEDAVQWVGKSNWIYQRTFDVPDDVLLNDRVLLRCEGLDTLATVKINGRAIGEANNMFRTWEFDVKPVLQSGQNKIEVLFHSPYPVMEARDSQRHLYEWIGSHEPKGRAWVRKEPCSFGWDWGPVLPSCGIWRNIGIETFNQGRIHDVVILQNHSDNKVALDIQVQAEIVRPNSRPFQAAVTVVDVSHPNRKITTATIPLSEGKGRGGWRSSIRSSGGQLAWERNRFTAFTWSYWTPMAIRWTARAGGLVCGN